jgi:hypothetical protein
MTKYYLEITTYKAGCPIRFEFSTKDLRETFLIMFINYLDRSNGNDVDYIINVTYGERTGASVK